MKYEKSQPSFQVSKFPSVKSLWVFLVLFFAMVFYEARAQNTIYTAFPYSKNYIMESSLNPNDSNTSIIAFANLRPRNAAGPVPYVVTVAEITSEGNMIWTKEYQLNGANRSMVPMAMCISNDSNGYIIAGHWTNDLSNSTYDHKGLENLFLLEIGIDGTLINSNFMYSYLGQNNDTLSFVPLDIERDVNSGSAYAVVGVLGDSMHRVASPSRRRMGRISLFNSSLQEITNKTFHADVYLQNNTFSPFCGQNSYFDLINNVVAIDQIHGGGYVIAGSATSYYNQNPNIPTNGYAGVGSAFISRLDANLNVVWSNKIDAKHTVFADLAYDNNPNTNGEVFGIVNPYVNNFNLSHGTIISYDLGGVLNYSKDLEFHKHFAESFLSNIKVTDNTIFLGGYAHLAGPSQMASLNLNNLSPIYLEYDRSNLNKKSPNPNYVIVWDNYDPYGAQQFTDNFLGIYYEKYKNNINDVILENQYNTPLICQNVDQIDKVIAPLAYYPESWNLDPYTDSFGTNNLKRCMVRQDNLGNLWPSVVNGIKDTIYTHFEYCEVYHQPDFAPVLETFTFEPLPTIWHGFSSSQTTNLSITTLSRSTDIEYGCMINYIPQSIAPQSQNSSKALVFENSTNFNELVEVIMEVNATKQKDNNLVIYTLDGKVLCSPCNISGNYSISTGNYYYKIISENKIFNGIIIIK